MEETIIQAKDYLISFFQQVSTFVQDKISSLGINYTGQLASVLTIFISLLFIYLGIKLTNKIIKVALIILGIILAVGTITTILQ